MKRIILSLFVILTSLSLLSAQDAGAKYYIFTSKESTDEGVLRLSILPYDMSTYNSIPITFEIRSKTKGFEVSFGHIDYNLTELAKIRKVFPKDYYEILYKPVSFLSTVNVVDLDVLFPTLTKEEAWKIRFNDSEKVYFIDRNDIKDGQVKLIQIRNKWSNKPRKPNLVIPE